MPFSTHCSQLQFAMPVTFTYRSPSAARKSKRGSSGAGGGPM